ncbi:adhesion G-protein coupled receptor G6-like [Ptychodera flava]|uniref:adhesion G-protein coupled receptor G6-like n=1 Tax=Ptychodera flava TaxID=63121 RepID=UPI00396A00A7
MAKLCRGLSFAVVVLYFTMVDAQNPREPHSGGKGRQSLCEADITFDDRGIIRWPSTRPGDIVDKKCPFSQDNTMRAWRECLALSSGANWSRANTSDCVPEDKASRGRRLAHLANTTIPRGQAKKVSRQLVNLTAEAEVFGAGDVALCADAVWNLLENCQNGTDVDVAKDILESVGNLLKVGRGVLKASQKKQNAAARLVKAIERLSQTLILGKDTTGGCNKSVTIEAPNFAMAVTEIDPSAFAGLKFKSTAEKIELVEEFYDDDSQNSTTKEDGSSISLPPTLFDGLDESALDQANRVQFVSHKCSTLFEAIDDSTSVALSPVIAAGIGGLKIGNLTPSRSSYPTKTRTEDHATLAVFSGISI